MVQIVFYSYLLENGNWFQSKREAEKNSIFSYERNGDEKHCVILKAKLYCSQDLTLESFASRYNNNALEGQNFSTKCKFH